VATVPLVVVVVLEQLFLKSTWFGTQLLYRFSSTPIFNIENKAAHAGNQNVTSLFSSGLEIPLKIFSSLATLECLVGLLLAGALGFAAVLIRQRKAL
jgi:type III secretory pathway component EscS